MNRHRIRWRSHNSYDSVERGERERERMNKYWMRWRSHESHDIVTVLSLTSEREREREKERKKENGRE